MIAMINFTYTFSKIALIWCIHAERSIFIHAHTYVCVYNPEVSLRSCFSGVLRLGLEMGSFSLRPKDHTD